MLSAMKPLSCAALLLALATPDAAAEQRDAQPKDCFTVTMSNAKNGGNLGSILLDRCTGNSWILAEVIWGEGRALNEAEFGGLDSPSHSRRTQPITALSEMAVSVAKLLF